MIAVWAPRASRVELAIGDRLHPMTRTEGWWSAPIDLPAGTARIPLSKQPVMEGARDGRAAPTQVPRYEPARPTMPSPNAPPAYAPPPYQAASPPAAPSYQPAPPPVSAPAAPAQTQHGAVRFSSVFGTRRR